MKGFRNLAILLVIVYVAVLIRTAWVCDDAYITFRSIENLINGYGPVYNVGERVQPYTHPLWMLLLSSAYFVTKGLLKISFPGHLYLLTVLISIIISTGAILLLLRLSRSAMASVWAVSALILSKAFVDYSTGGLENPLTYLLLAAFYLLFFYFRQRSLDKSPRAYFWLFFIASLAYVNRQDIVLLYLPVLIWLAIRALLSLRENYRMALALMLGVMPVVLWGLFATFYYGFPFPNTYYAKVGSGFETSLLIKQGIFYLTNSLSMDPITLVAIAFFSTIVIANTTDKKVPLLLVSGIVLYMLYTVKIGGDFMAGRYLAAPLLASALLLAGYAPDEGMADSWKFTVAVGLVILGLSSPLSSVFSDANYQIQVEDWKDNLDHTGIADERAVYFPLAGLMKRNTTTKPYVVFLDQPGELDKGIFGDVRVSQAYTDEVGGYYHYPDSYWAVHGWEVDAGDGGEGQGWEVMRVSTMGIRGYRAGPNLHVIDFYALVDPLRARLPVPEEYKTKWRVGHFPRPWIDGYVKTIESGQNQIQDPSLAEYYDKLSLVVSGDLFDLARLVEIWNFNTGKYDYLLKRYVEQE